jgi:glucose/arabinose dehydrogenase
MPKTVKAKRKDINGDAIRRFLHIRTKKSTKKYVTRSSPSYSANEHCGKVKKGNDGKMYISTPDKNKICRWKKVA